MGSKRARPWSLQPTGSSVAAAAAALALAALSVGEVGALSRSCTAKDTAGRWDDDGRGTTCTTCQVGRRDVPRQGRKALVLSGSRPAAASTRRSCHAQSVIPVPSAPPGALPSDSGSSGGREGSRDSSGSGRRGTTTSGGSSRGGLRLRDRPAEAAVRARQAVEEPAPRPAAAAAAARRADRNSRSKSPKRGGQGRGRRDNDVRMFLMERGLSHWEVRKVLPIMRRDPELVNDIATLAARMQVCAYRGAGRAYDVGDSCWRRFLCLKLWFSTFAGKVSRSD